MARVPTVFTCLMLLAGACTGEAMTEPTRGSTIHFSAHVQPNASALIAPGVPGTASCRGQTERFAAQGDAGLADTHGIGGLASLAGLSASELNAFIDQYCSGS